MSERSWLSHTRLDRRFRRPAECGTDRHRRRFMPALRKALLVVAALVFVVGCPALAGVPKIILGENYTATW